MIGAMSRCVAQFIEATGFARSLQHMLRLCALSVAGQGCECRPFVVLADDFGGAAWQAPSMSFEAGSLATAISGAPGYSGAFHYSQIGGSPFTESRPRLSPDSH